MKKYGGLIKPTPFIKLHFTLHVFGCHNDESLTCCMQGEMIYPADE